MAIQIKKVYLWDHICEWHTVTRISLWEKHDEKNEITTVILRNCNSNFEGQNSIISVF